LTPVRKRDTKVKARTNCWQDSVKMTPGDVKLTPGDVKLTPGDVKLTPGDVKMTHSDVKMIPRVANMSTYENG